nr:FkbM family methyltransferase [Aeromicrobium sp.]
MSAIISNAQNREDVILWRALQHVTAGRYVEVGANHPTIDSVSRVFYDHGWSGVTVEPVPYLAELQRAERPRDVLVQAAVSSADAGEIVLHVVPGTGLSTTVDTVSDQHLQAGIEHEDLVVPTLSLNVLLAQQALSGKDIHFLLVDVEGAEEDVLRGLDLNVWRPWVLVVEATAPNSTTPTHHAWEPDLLAHRYEFCLFDGLSRYYVAAEKADELRRDLSYPASVWDDYQTAADAATQRERDDLRVQTTELVGQLTHWRSLALSSWADAVSRDLKQRKEIARQRETIKRLRGEIRKLRASTSWRVTRPLRKASTMVGRR